MKVKRILSLTICMLLVFSSIYTAAEETTSGEKLLPASIVQADGELWGFINLNGAFVIKPEYVFVSGFNENGIAIAAKGANIYGICSVYFLDKNGKTVSGPYKAYISSYDNGIAIINGTEGTSWVVDSSGRLVFSCNDQLYKYSGNMIGFSRKMADGSTLYGFRDYNGKIVVPAKYKGLYEYPVKQENSTWPATYYDESVKKYGYKEQDGRIVIMPAFYSAESFDGEFAVVGIETAGYVHRFALINKKGEYVIKPEYSGISSLGQGLYAVSRGSDMSYLDWYLPKAIFNDKGEKLTDYKYYSVGRFEGEYAAASDDTTSFFIDKTGSMVNELPRLKGIGSLALKDGIIEAALDGGLEYLTKDGSILWQKEEAIPLGNGISARTVKYRTDYLNIAKYPVLEGLGNKTVQESINKKLIDLFTHGIGKQNTFDDAEDYLQSNEVDFSVQRNRNLLIIEKSGYMYPIGAAHGQPSKIYYYIDLQTGKFYELKDLFKAGSKYAEKLTSLVVQKHALHERVYKTLYGDGYYYSEPSVYDGQCFLIGTDSIRFIYQPYEIAAYAAGFPEFEITYGQMSGILNTEGAFWNSFDKKILQNKVSLVDSGYEDSMISDSLKSSLSHLIDSYENKIIEAINTNSFSKVAPYLLKDSNLYNSQVKLVQNLYKKGTREKLVSYEIQAISYDGSKKEYRIFVSEVVGIQYAGKSYVNKKYDWCYTARLDSSSNGYKLSDIVK